MSNYVISKAVLLFLLFPNIYSSPRYLMLHVTKNSCRLNVPSIEARIIELRQYTQNHIVTSLSRPMKLPLFRKYSIGVELEEVKAAATAFLIAV